MFQHVAVPADPAGHAGEAGGHGLEQRVRQPLRPGRQQEDLAGPKQRLRIRTRAQESDRRAQADGPSLSLRIRRAGPSPANTSCAVGRRATTRVQAASATSSPFCGSRRPRNRTVSGPRPNRVWATVKSVTGAKRTRSTPFGMRAIRSGAKPCVKSSAWVSVLMATTRRRRRRSGKPMLILVCRGGRSLRPALRTPLSRWPADQPASPPRPPPWPPGTDGARAGPHARRGVAEDGGAAIVRTMPRMRARGRWRPGRVRFGHRPISPAKGHPWRARVSTVTRCPALTSPAARGAAAPSPHRRREV